MASDRQQFERAMERWNSLHAEKSYSVPPEVGRAAIICSYYTDVFGEVIQSGVSVRASKAGVRDVRRFRSEAFALAELIEQGGQDTVVILDAVPDDMRDVLTDPAISDILLIGHGSLSELFMQWPNDGGNIYGWQDVSKDADHLKLGKFVQRHCGGILQTLVSTIRCFCG